MNLLNEIEGAIGDLGWDASWVEDNEIVALVPGKWCDYQMHFIWQESIGALYIVCCPDVRFDEPYSIDLLRFVIGANQRLWMGHFDLLEDGSINYRHVIHLYDLDVDCLGIIKEVSFVMFSEFELFYPGFEQLKGNFALSTKDIDLLSLETRGKA